MITKDDILQKSVSFAREVGTANIELANYFFQHGAIWATGRAVTEIAELVEVVGSLKAGYEDLIRSVKMDNNHFDITTEEKTALSRADELIKKYGK